MKFRILTLHEKRGIFYPVLEIKEKKLRINIIFFTVAAGAQLCYSEETSGGSERVGGSSSLTTQAEQTLLFRANFFCADKLGKGRLGVRFIFSLSPSRMLSMFSFYRRGHYKAVFRYSF